MEDNEIVDLYWSRSQNAVPETDKKYRTRCLNVAFNVLRDKSDAEECLNDTYMTAWNLMPDERPVYLSAFLFRIIKNHALNRYTWHHRGKRDKNNIVPLDELGECADINSTESEFDKNELVKYLNEFLYSLSDEHRYMFIRRYWYLDEISVIAEKFNTSDAGMKMTMMRLRKKLKKFLEEKGYQQ